jgi:DNA transformation protein
MLIKDEFTRYCAELLSSAGAVRVRRMFGGHGLYVDDLFIAIIAAEQLYLKADTQSRSQFEAAGCQPFRYQKEGEWTTLNYFAPPAETLDSPALMQPWARLALQAALRTRLSHAAKPARPKPA